MTDIGSYMTYVGPDMTGIGSDMADISHVRQLRRQILDMTDPQTWHTAHTWQILA
jgi:hypothetical protein